MRFSIFSKSWERTRMNLARARYLPILSLFGLITGAMVGLIIIAFRLLIETSQAGFLPGSNPENYESLPQLDRLMLLAGGSVVLGVLFYLVSRTPVRVGVLHVIDRLAYHEGHLPLRNAAMQFIGGALAIVSGHSVGREGPCIHLGAATASLMGQRLFLPNNCIRTLVACGTAAAIAASFNTPLAGVIFAMEVVVMEYTITGFTPVILAAVSATTVNRLVFDAEPVFHVPSFDLVSFWELPVIILMGVVIGGMAALFIRMVGKVTQLSQAYPVWLTMTLAGLLVGCCALVVPEVMGVGYDTVNAAIYGEIAVVSLLMILVFKLLATAISVGMGIPAGLISPVIFIGAIMGSFTGMLVSIFFTSVSPPGLYAMLGMGAMMGAALQAPLAALLALLELTANENIIFPGMLAIVSASLASRELFRQKSIYLSQIQGVGMDYRNDPVAQSLRRLAVGSVMNESFSIVNPVIKRDEAERILAEEEPQWLVIYRDTGHLLLPATDLARYINELQQDEFNMLEVPGRRLQLKPIRQQSTLQQAWTTLTDPENEAEALYVIRPVSAPGDIFGIITMQDIEQSYRTINVE